MDRRLLVKEMILDEFVPAKIEENAHNASSTHPSMPRACACGCGRTFNPKREWQIYYSKKCRQRANLKGRSVNKDIIKKIAYHLNEAMTALKELK
ncbi:MAG: hypothetical protein ACXWMO_06415 [Syntrophales bacterium]